jgi:hypothetical protein
MNFHDLVNCAHEGGLFIVVVGPHESRIATYFKGLHVPWPQLKQEDEGLHISSHWPNSDPSIPKIVVLEGPLTTEKSKTLAILSNLVLFTSRSFKVTTTPMYSPGPELVKTSSIIVRMTPESYDMCRGLLNVHYNVIMLGELMEISTYGWGVSGDVFVTGNPELERSPWRMNTESDFDFNSDGKPVYRSDLSDVLKKKSCV